MAEANSHHVHYSLGKEWHHLSGPELFKAVAFAVRDQLVDRMLTTEERYRQAQAKRLYYLSIEFLMGRSLRNNLYNLGLFRLCQEALRTLGVELTMVEESERDATLGNDELGRLTACFLDSLATFTNSARWAHKAILNAARVGVFSSDRTIRQYAKDIWQIASIPEGSRDRELPL